MAGRDGQPVAVLGDAAEVIDVADVQLRIDAHREQVEGQVDDVDVAGALAVAEQRALHAVGPRHDAELGRRHAAAPVVVRVQGQHDTVPVADSAVEPLDDVAVHVRRVALHGGGQVQDELVVAGVGLDDVHDRLADLHREVGLGEGEALRGVLVADDRVGDGLLELPGQGGGAGGDVDDARLVQAEDHPPLERVRRVVEVHDGPGRPAQALVRPLQQLGPALHQHLDGDVRGDQVLLDEDAHEVVVGAGRPPGSRPRFP